MAPARRNVFRFVNVFFVYLTVPLVKWRVASSISATLLLLLQSAWPFSKKATEPLRHCRRSSVFLVA